MLEDRRKRRWDTRVLSISKDLKGQLGPRVSDITIFPSIEVIWGPTLVTSRISINRGQLQPRVGDITFFHQERSVGAPCCLRHVFPPREVSRGLVLVTSHFLDDIYIMMKCVSVCNEKWSLPWNSWLDVQWCAMMCNDVQWCATKN